MLKNASTKQPCTFNHSFDIQHSRVNYVLKSSVLTSEQRHCA